MTAANLPLADIRVLEIGHIIAGPSGAWCAPISARRATARAPEGTIAMSAEVELN